MAELRTVEIDFDVHKRIELARTSFAETPNAVLRRLLSIEAAAESVSALAGGTARAWSGKGVLLPNGTRVRMDYNGRSHGGSILDGTWIVEGARFSSPSAAASGVARTKKGEKTNLDGWIYWQVQMPNATDWVRLADLRNGAQSTPAVTPSITQERHVNVSHLSVDLPPESEVIMALEDYLEKSPRAVTPSEAYLALADHFQLSFDQRSRLMDNGKDCHWENRVRFARRKLVDAGKVEREPRGLWSIKR